MAAGDLLSVVCRWGGLKYRHFGVDLGDGSVMHLAGDANLATWNPTSWGRMSVRRVSIDEFSGGSEVRIEKRKSPLEVDETMERALAWEGRTGYHLCERNCEHFARWCTTGDYSSFQVDRCRMGFRVAMRCSVKAAAAASHRSTLAKSLVATAAPGLAKLQKWTPAAWLSDLAEVGVVMAGRRLGVHEKANKRLGKATGIATAAVVGMVQGGPVGATMMVGTHVAARELADFLADKVESAVARTAKSTCP